MKTKPKSIIFFVILIAIVVVLALVVGDRTDASKPNATYSEFLGQVQAGQDPPHVLRSSEENVFDHITVGWEPLPAGTTQAEFRERKKLPRGRVAASV